MAGDKSLYSSNGGQYTNTVVANTAYNSLANSTAGVLSNSGVSSTSTGRLCKVVVLGNTVNSITIYDNSSGPGGPILFQSPINTAVTAGNNVYDLQASFTSGLWLSSATNQPACVLTWALSGVGGNA